jgi:CO dehydrogenase maturation factor
MKVAIAGKGGSGKTSISGTLARLAARSGHRVLAIDGDSNPNLALTLGIAMDRVDDLPTLPSGLIERTDDGIQLKSTLDEVVDTHSMAGPDGVTLLVMAHPQHAGKGCLCGMHATVRSLIEAAPGGDADLVLLDTEASPEHLARGTAKYADALIVVVEPYYKSLETGRRMAELAHDLGLERVALVANKVRDEKELDAVREFSDAHGLELVGVVPFDEHLPDAERDRSAPLDFAPDAPAVAAIGKLGERFLSNGAGANGSGR